MLLDYLPLSTISTFHLAFLAYPHGILSTLWKNSFRAIWEVLADFCSNAPIDTYTPLAYTSLCDSLRHMYSLNELKAHYQMKHTENFN